MKWKVIRCWTSPELGVGYQPRTVFDENEAIKQFNEWSDSLSAKNGCVLIECNHEDWVITKKHNFDNYRVVDKGFMVLGVESNA